MTTCSAGWSTRRSGDTEWSPFKLPPWIHVVITEDGDSKWLTVRSRIHVNKEVRMEPSFSRQFSDWDILKDLSGKISHAYL
ncbi:hypothetical protein [Pseudomonas phage vB_Pa-PAC6]